MAKKVEKFFLIKELEAKIWRQRRGIRKLNVEVDILRKLVAACGDCSLSSSVAVVAEMAKT